MIPAQLPLPLWQLTQARRPLGAFFVSFVLATVLGTLALMGCQGCGPHPIVQAADAAVSATTPRNRARATIVLLSHATLEADKFCAAYGLSTKNAALLDRCAASYDIARDNLLAAEGGVDAWDTAAQGEIACATALGAAAAGELADALTAAGATVPAALGDALNLYSSLMSGTCPKKDGGS